ncbi:MAG: VWA domain-containing protein [Candidatus Aenigmatarchaeota archaeon]
MAGLEQPILLLTGILAAFPVYIFFRKSQKMNRVSGAARAIVVLLLAVAAAQPFVQAESKVSEDPTVKLLLDKSSSTSLLKSENFSIEGIDVERRTIATGNSSDLKSGFLQTLEPNTAYLAVSDFRSDESLQNVPEKFSEQNSSLNAMKFDTKSDSSVVVRGPSSTVPEAENRFTVKVTSTRDGAKPEVTIDGEKVSLVKKGDLKWVFDHKFERKGGHKIKAAIETRDTFKNNNQFFKTVEVMEKPKILFLGEKGKLGEKLSRFYEIEYRSSPPSDMQDYYAVVASRSFESEDLEEYVTRGNGLVYTGDYDQSIGVLPVKKSEVERDTEAAKIMLTVDISVSTGKSGVKMSKKIAYNLVEELPGNTKVGVVAYNDNAHLVSDPKILATNRDELKSRIASLKTGGPSRHQNGVKGAKRALNGTGNIIFISDGRAPDTEINGRIIENTADEEALKVASTLGEVRLISVGVGSDRNTDFLTELARRGDGRYIDARNADRLRFSFAAGGAGSGTTQLKKAQDHFITNGLEFDSQVAAFDRAEPKEGGNLLVTGRGGEPFLTTWRYGIGRVAAFTGDNKELGQVLESDPLLVSRTVSWAAGSPKRKQERWIEASDARRPAEVKIRASYPEEGLKRKGEGLYVRNIEPESVGIGSFAGKSYAYNYNDEYEKVGYNPDMKEMVRDTGGQVYTPNETEELKQDIKTFSRKKTIKKQKLGSFFIAAALLVFLAEIGYRKVNGKK